MVNSRNFAHRFLKRKEGAIAKRAITTELVVIAPSETLFDLLFFEIDFQCPNMLGG